MSPLSRRGLFRGSLVTLVGGVGGYLAARGSSTVQAARGSSAANAYGPPTASTTRALVALSGVPVGGGVVLQSDEVVVTRPSEDDVRAFSAVCTHQGCTVSDVAGGVIACPCHGSRFDAATGAVRRGPAARPLPPVAVVVRSGEVFRA